MPGDAYNLQDLALRIARLPRADRLQFLNTVLMLAELGETTDPSPPEHRPGLPLHPPAVLALCREKLARGRELAECPGWGHARAGLLAATLCVDRLGSAEGCFTTPLLNRTIRELDGEGGWEINVQSLHGLDRKGLLSRQPGTHPIQFRFTAEGYRVARELAERPL